ncbi:MAG: DUF2007 domain-containing protein [Solirubrobacterales bacterium]
MSIFKSSREPEPEPVQVAFADNKTEAELIQGILREEGIPSITRKPNGTFLTDLFGIGAREILVPAAAEEKAGKILEDVEQAEPLPGE